MTYQNESNNGTKTALLALGATAAGTGAYFATDGFQTNPFDIENGSRGEYANYQDPVSIGKNGQVVIEAELEKPVGDWEVRNIKGETAYYWDSPDDSFNKPQDTLKYKFTVDQDGDYHISMRTYRPSTGEESDRNNDFFVKLVDEDGNVVKDDTKLFFSHDRNEWGWTNKFDYGNHNFDTPKFDNLKAGGTYTLEVSGRSRDAAFDRIHLQNGSVNKDANAAESEIVEHNNIAHDNTVEQQVQTTSANGNNIDTSNTQTSDIQNQTDHSDTNNDVNPLLVAGSILSAGIISLGVAGYNHYHARKNYKETIDRQVQEQYQKQIDKKQHLSPHKIYGDANLKQTKDNYIKQSSRTWSITGFMMGAGITSTAIAASGILTGTALSGGLLPLALIGAGLAGGGVSSIISSFTSKNLITNSAERYLARSISNPENQKGITYEQLKLEEAALDKDKKNMLEKTNELLKKQHTNIGNVITDRQSQKILRPKNPQIQNSI